MNLIFCLDSMKCKVGRFLHSLKGLAWVFVLLSLGSCLGIRYLEPGESLLYTQRIEGAEEVDPEDLDNLYRQEPNSRLPFLPVAPYVGFYQAGLRRYDQDSLRDERQKVRSLYDSLLAQATPETGEYRRLERQRRKKLNRLDKSIAEGNLLMRWGEPLVVYDENQTVYTTQQMEQYLFNRGYFQAEADYAAETKRRRTRVTYTVKEGPAYVLDSLVLVTRDTALAHLYREHMEESLIKVGDNYNAEVLEDERNRIDRMLKDNGYFAFSRNYVSYEVDSTTLRNRRLVLRTLIGTPPDRSAHQVFRIDSVIVTTDANKNLPGQTRHREVVNDVIYRYYEDEYAKRILDRRIFLSPGDLYSRSNTLATQRQLANLDNFKFINIKYDTLGGRFTALLYMSPLPKRQISDEIGLVVSQGIPGPLVNVTFTNRNVFKHLENLQTSGRFSIEGVPDGYQDNTNGTSTEASANVSLFFPQFLLPVSDAFKRKLGYVNPRTRAQLGYAFNNRPQYTRSTVNAGFVYTWETRRGTRYSYSLWDLSLINSSDIREDFQEFLDKQASQGNALARTFEPSLVSSTSVSATYNFLGQESSQQHAAYLRALIDVGGTLWNVLNTDKVFGAETDLEFFQYIKLSTDFIRYKPLANESVLAYRFNIGVAGSYAENGILPYEKYFFLGGSNSVRAWAPRRLGPGSFSQRDSLGFVKAGFDQPGELLLASSVEWRTPLFGFIDGALFLDVGNVWTLKNDPSRPGADFEFNRFWREFAVGAGVGVRADFSFLILRVDLGVKLHDPAFDPGQRWLPQGEYYNYSNPFALNNEAYILNLGIGYPF